MKYLYVIHLYSDQTPLMLNFQAQSKRLTLEKRSISSSICTTLVACVILVFEGGMVSWVQMA